MDLLVLTDSQEGESQESWQGYTATVRRRPIWEWLLGGIVRIDKRSEM